MNVEAFRVACKDFDKGKPFHNLGKYKEVWKRIKKAAARQHVGKGSSDGFCDLVRCSCGWKSTEYWDGLEYAWDNWVKHVADEMGLTPKECPCGKEYVPADGEKPCHELTKIKN